MRLGTAGVPGNDRTHFNAPSDIVVAPNGDVFVADGHGVATNNRVVKFGSDGRYIKEWGGTGTGPGQFRTHARDRDRRARPRVHRRPRQQPRPAVRPGRHAPRDMDAVRPAERHLLRSSRPHHRRGLRVRRRREPRLGHGPAHRRRGDGRRARVHPLSVGRPARARWERRRVRGRRLATATSTAASPGRGASRSTCACGRDAISRRSVRRWERSCRGSPRGRRGSCAHRDP